MGAVHTCFNDLSSESVHLLTLLWALEMNTIQHEHSNNLTD